MQIGKDETAVRVWLYRNIENRFYIGSHGSVKGSVFVSQQVVAFENPADATFFGLIQDTL